jgi:type IV/VI secretion system ImpK/VasF family protein
MRLFFFGYPMEDKLLIVPSPTSDHAIATKENHLVKPKPNQTPLGPNPLVAAGHKLFSIMSELQSQELHFKTEELINYLVKETQAFTHHAEEIGYSQESVIISRYVVCETFDKIIMETNWGKSHSWKPLASQFSHYEQLHGQLSGIIKRMCQLPPAFIDVLEFVYICRSIIDSPSHTAYQDKELNQELYHIINVQRGDCEKKLSNIKANEKTKQPKKTSLIGLWLGLIILAIFVVAAYAFFSYNLKQSSSQIETHLLQIKKNQQPTH